MITPLSFTVGADTIYGIAHEPAIDEAPGWCVIILSGPGTNRCGPHRLHVDISRRLEENGIRNYRFDFRGRGESTGCDLEINVHSMAEDLLEFIDHLRMVRPAITKCLVIANCLSCVSAVKVFEASSFIRSCLLIGAQELHDNAVPGTRMAEMLMTARKYIGKMGYRSTWAKLYRREVSYRQVSRSFSNILPSVYVTKDKTYKRAVAGRLRMLKDTQPVHKSLYCIYGEQDPLKKESAWYGHYAQQHNWTFDAFVMPGADRNFRDPSLSQELTALLLRLVQSFIHQL